MIQVKNPEQLRLMRDAGRITAEALLYAEECLRPGMTTKELDTKIHDYIVKQKARPSFLGYAGFPGSACISINSEVIHGIPSHDVIIRDGDIVKVDVGACYRGYHGDSARTFAVGDVGEEASRLITVTKMSFFEGVKFATAGNRIGNIGSAIQRYVEENGFSVVRKYIGHGVGKDLHEDPEVPNFGTAGRGARLCTGMTLAIEPMVNVGTADVKTLRDGWTVVTADGKLSAHYENTVAVTADGPVILTEA